MFALVRKWKVYIPPLLLVLVVTLIYISKHKHRSQTYFVVEHYQPNGPRDLGQLPASGDDSQHTQGDAPVVRHHSRPMDSTSPAANESVGVEIHVDSDGGHNIPSEPDQLHHQSWSEKPVSSASVATPSISVIVLNKTASVLGEVQPTEGEEEATPISLSSDIDKRGEWQKQQVEAYCRKYDLTKEQYEFPPDQWSRLRLFRHLLADDKRKVLFAFIPKVGCTNTRRFFHLMGGVIPMKTMDIVHIDEDFQMKYMEPAIWKTSFMRSSLNDIGRKNIVKTYYKYTILRHPLERMVSAYKDKIEPPLVHGGKHWTDQQKENIVKRFQAEEYKRWQQSGFSFPMKIPFHVYARWLVETRDVYLNEHFGPVIISIYPCRIKYDFYGTFNQLVSDIQALADKFDVPHNYFQEQGYHRPGRETQEFVQSYFSRLDEDMKRKVFQEFYQDLDFYYHLFPEERTSHCQMLGIDDLVV